MEHTATEFFRAHRKQPEVEQLPIEEFASTAARLESTAVLLRDTLARLGEVADTARSVDTYQHQLDQQDRVRQAELDEQQSKASAAAAAADQAITVLRQQLEQQTETTEQAQNALDEQLAVNEQQASDLAGSAQTIHTLNTELAETIRMHEQVVANLNNDHTAALTALTERTQSQITAAETAAELAERAAELEHISATSAQAQLADTRAELEHLRTEHERTLKRRLADTKSEITALLTAQHSTAVATLNGDIAKLQAELRGAQQLSDAYKHQLENIKPPT